MRRMRGADQVRAVVHRSSDAATRPGSTVPGRTSRVAGRAGDFVPVEHRGTCRVPSGMMPGMARFLGYLNRRPYLWWVDLERRIVEPAAELMWIPQGIDEVVPLGDVVAVRCGPSWFGLRPSLNGGGFDLPPAHRVEAERRSSQVSAVWPKGVAPMDARVRVPVADGEEWEVTHPEIQRWAPWGTLSPNRRSLAVVGYTGSLPKSHSVADIADGTKHDPHPGSLVIADLATRVVRPYRGTFEGFGVSAWTADGRHVVVGAPFDPKALFIAPVDANALERMEFRRHAPSPLLDADLLAPDR